MTLEAIISAILSLPGVDAFAAPIAAEAIHAVAPTPARASRLIAVGYFESKFLARIARGECRTYVWRGQRIAECDAGRARHWWQAQHTSLAPEWPRLLGIDAPTVRLAATVADRTLERGMRACRTVEKTMSYYARGSCRGFRGAANRARLAAAIERRLTNG